MAAPSTSSRLFIRRNEGAWGIFDISGKVVCANGDGFAYNSSGAWDSKGFRAAGSSEAILEAYLVEGDAPSGRRLPKR